MRATLSVREDVQGDADRGGEWEEEPLPEEEEENVFQKKQGRGGG